MAHARQTARESRLSGYRLIFALVILKGNSCELPLSYKDLK